MKVTSGYWRCGVVAWVLLAVAIAGSAAAIADNRDAPELPTDWVSEIGRDHPLAGQIYDVREKRLVDADEAARALALARFPLLGEIHDNADHHLWQAWAIRAISKLRGSRIVEGAPQLDFIAMEMLRTDQYPGIDKFYGRDAVVPRRRKARSFGRMVGWDESGWPDFKIYEPIIAQAQYEQMSVVPALGPRASDRGVSKDGLAAFFGAAELKRLALDDALPDDAMAELISEIRNGHCGLLPEATFPRMSEVQRFRDATMADALLSAGDIKGAILIAGNGHVRRDRGVPMFLAARGVGSSKIVAFGLKEVADGEVDPESYGLRNKAGEPLYDLVAFTPRHEREDPCTKMRAQFGKGSPASSETKK